MDKLHSLVLAIREFPVRTCFLFSVANSVRSFWFFPRTRLTFLFQLFLSSNIYTATLLIKHPSKNVLFFFSTQVTTLDFYKQGLVSVFNRISFLLSLLPLLNVHVSLGMTLTCIQWWGFSSGALGSVEYPDISIFPKSTLTRSGITH